MKGLIALIIIGMVTVTTSSYGATKCVKLDASKSCVYKDPGRYKTNWATTCDGVAISGVSKCGNQAAEYKDKSEDLTTSGTAEENMQCWCKMTGPVVSSWVFRSGGISAADCEYSCAYACALSVSNDSDFRSALFSDLGI